ncbi:aldo/keto reductase [bacterium]|nr:aldo/keto reductase [bacterium]
MNRRDFIKGSLAVAALAALGGCKQGKETTDVKEGSNGKKKGEMTKRKLGSIAGEVSLLGYGLMRLPLKDRKNQAEIDKEKAQELIDKAMAGGVNYYDTAWVYHQGMSERFAGEALKKYPRESYNLADKMPVWEVKSIDDAKRIFQEQLDRCQAEYFDFYLMHSLNGGAWPNVRDNGALEYARQMKKEGKVKNLGFSFHGDNKDLAVIADFGGWDFAQIQLNYFDWDDYSKEQYEILTSHGIPVVVMEPLKGGELANLRPKTLEMLTNARPNTTAAQWAFEFIASLPNVLTILSGMTYMEHVEENLKTFSPIEPLSDEGKELLAKVKEFMKEEGKIPCTTCRYCTPCPVGVVIPDIFKMYNNYRSSLVKWMSQREYFQLAKESRADACVECGACLKKCPQKINIPEELKRVHKEFTS